MSIGRRTVESVSILWRSAVRASAVCCTIAQDRRSAASLPAVSTGRPFLPARAGTTSAESRAKRFEIGAVAITLRDQTVAAVIAAEGKTYSAPRFEVESVDPIGGGDAFCGGLIVSRLDGLGWHDAVRFAHATAALKHTIPGDFCLVTRSHDRRAGSR